MNPAQDKIQEGNNSIHIRSSKNPFIIDFSELWKYRYLLFLFVKRDFITVYKQTLLGPLWYFLQPLITTVTYYIVFNKIGRIQTEGPAFLFYLAGITPWNYFSSCFQSNSNSLVSNASLFGKIYFPRLILPISIIFSNFIKFMIQLILFIMIWSAYLLFTEDIHPNYTLIYVPLYLIILALLGMAMGLMISALSTKYRDFQFLLGFSVQFIMYTCPIIYPLKIIPDKYKIYFLLNPLTSLVEAFKYGFIGTGYFSPLFLGYSFLFTLVMLYFSIVLFNKKESTFMDSV